MPSIPFPRLLLEFLSVLFPFVVEGWRVNSDSYTASISTTLNDSYYLPSCFIDEYSANQNREERQSSIITNIKIDPQNKTVTKQNSGNQSKSKVCVLTDFDKLRNLFPEIPVSFRSEKITKNHGSNLECENINNGTEKKDTLQDYFRNAVTYDDRLSDLYTRGDDEDLLEKKDYQRDSSQNKMIDDRHLEEDVIGGENHNKRYNFDRSKYCDHKENISLGLNAKFDKIDEKNIRNENYHNHNHNKNGNKNKNKIDITNSNGNNKSNNKNRVQHDKELLIGFPELWLSCLKTLVNLSHNCTHASSILMGQDCNNIYENHNKNDIKKNNYDDNTGKLICNITTSEDENNGPNNLMVVCCAALSICISKRNEIELEQKLKLNANAEQTENLQCSSTIDPRSPRYRKKPNESDRHVSDHAPHTCITSSDKSSERISQNVPDVGTLSPGETATEVR